MEQEHAWLWDEWEDENGTQQSDLYCCKCFLIRDFSKSEEEEEPCVGHHK